MKKYFKKIPTILMYSFCLVGISLFWTNFAEAAFIDSLWWKQFRTEGSIMLYGIILFSIYSVIEEKGPFNYLAELFMELIIFIIQYLIFGWIFNWYDLKTWWAMPLQCLPVFAVIYLLRLRNINKDIDFINSRLANDKVEG